MDQVQKITVESINEFGSEATIKKYQVIADEGLWESEKILIDKYFPVGSKILDVGCGSGRTAMPLFKAGHSVVGVDFTPQMIGLAKKKAVDHKLAINYRIGDATNLEFANDLFDGAIFAPDGFAQIPGKQKRQDALNEIHRVLKPGGVLILTAHKRYYDLRTTFFWLGQFIKLHVLKPAGLKAKELELGDIFFRRQSIDNHKLKQQQFIHMSREKEVEKQINNSKFKL